MFRALQKKIHAIAVEKWWWETERNVGECLMLVTTEIAEAMEAYRKTGDVTDRFQQYHTGKPEGFVYELADAVIRIMDFCGKHELDLYGAMKEKIEFNKTRPYRHGGKKA